VNVVGGACLGTVYLDVFWYVLVSSFKYSLGVCLRGIRGFGIGSLWSL
jgi:hypothetical protein